MRSAKANIAAWHREIAGEGLDAIVITTSGCGTVIKDYGYHVPQRSGVEGSGAGGVGARARHQRVSGAARAAARIGGRKAARRVSFRLLAAAWPEGDRVRRRNCCGSAGLRGAWTVPEGHLCCGSAGTYNMLQPELSPGLRDRKAANINGLAPDLIATGNIGCMQQLEGAVECADPAYGRA